jgi:hypothetical protein
MVIVTEHFALLSFELCMQQGTYIHSEWALPLRQGPFTRVGFDQCWQVQGTTQGTDSNPKFRILSKLNSGSDLGTIDFLEKPKPRLIELLCFLLFIREKCLCSLPIEEQGF